MRNRHCILGLHLFKYIKGDFNKYYECKICGKRKVLFGVGGYEPVYWKWLENEKNKPLGEAWYEFSLSMHNLMWEIFKALKIPEIVEWLNKKLQWIDRKLHK